MTARAALPSWNAWLLGAALAIAPISVSQGQVRFERTGFRLTSIGERIAVSGRVLDAGRKPVPSTRIRWRMADPSIASVSTQGVVVSRRAGNTRLWAVAGEDSAFALIVVDQWAAKFDFSPALVRLDAVGAKAPLRIRMRDAEGHLIGDQNRRPTGCRSLNERVATLAATGEVSARANGVTYVRCTDRGIADSVRIEVRQRPARVTIADKLAFGNKVVGDTFRIRLTAVDRSNDEIREPQATWASLNPTIVAVDPLSGMARSVGTGTAKVVAQVGDVTDTVSVAVAPGIGLAVPANADTAATVAEIVAARVPTLQIDALYPIEGEQTTARMVARDASGAEVANPDVTLRSTDTTVFVVLAGQKVQSRKTGQAWLIGRFGTVVDSARVDVRPLTANAGADAAAARATQAAFRRPTFPVDSLRNVYVAARTRSQDSMFKVNFVGRAATGRFIALSATAGQTAYTFSDSTGPEKRTGLLIGGTAKVAPFRWLGLAGDFRTGTLTSGDAAGGNDLTLTEAGADLTLQPTSWLGLRGGFVRRALREGEAGANKIALQQWNFARLSLISHLTFLGGQVRGVAGLSVLPYATYSGVDTTSKPDPFSISGEAGLEVHTGWLSAGLVYYVEKFTIPKVDGSQRIDQFSTIRLRLGLQRGR